MLKVVLDIDDIMKKRNRNNNNDAVNDYQRVSFESFSEHRRLKARMNARKNKHNANYVKEDRMDDVNDDSIIPEDKFKLFLSEKYIEKKASHEDWKLIKRLQDAVKDINTYDGRSNVPTIDKYNYHSQLIKIHNAILQSETNQ